MTQRPPGASAPETLPQAAALQYEAGAEGAPRVIAKGRGVIAQEIIRRAREAGVPIHESRELAAALGQFELDQQIPPALYVAIAEVLAWAYRLEASHSGVQCPSQPNR
jgi:flagellar biosynthesis protein